MKIVAIIQARMSSTRLPGKVLKKIKDKSLLEILVERLRHSKKIDEIVIATSNNKKDIAIVDLAKNINCPYFIGDENDVLDRFYHAARKFKADVIMRVTGDCPLHDPKLVDKIIDFYLKNIDRFDYVSNVDPPTFPDGLDLRVFPFKTLEKAWKEAKLKSEREHVCPYIWKNKNLFRIGHFKSKADYSNMRWTVDDATDFEFVKKIYENLDKKGEIFHMEDILDFLKKNPHLLKIQEYKIRDEGLIKSVKEDGKIEKKKLKILITGANGLLGSNLCLMYSKNHEVYATSKTKPKIPNCSNYKLDILNREDLTLIENKKPDIIIHCAALVNVDYCEEHPEKAEKINTLGTENIAESAKKSGSYLIHISTDTVFDGTKGNYSENSPTNPINVYGKTKLGAEHKIQQIHDYYAIIRTNIYGWNRQNKSSLAEWMLGKLEKGEELSAVKDVFFSPLLVNNLGEALLELYYLNYRGILNIAGSESCSKLAFARKLVKIFNMNDNLINPVSINDLKLKAKRARDMTLNVEKAKKLLETKLLNAEEGLKKFKELKEKGFVNELRKNE